VTFDVKLNVNFPVSGRENLTLLWNGAGSAQISGDENGTVHSLDNTEIQIEEEDVELPCNEWCGFQVPGAIESVTSTGGYLDSRWRSDCWAKQKHWIYRHGAGGQDGSNRQQDDLVHFLQNESPQAVRFGYATGCLHILQDFSYMNNKNSIYPCRGNYSNHRGRF